MKLSELFNSRYLPYIKRHLKPKTVAEYERLARTELLPRLGGYELDFISLDEAEALHEAVPGKVQANRAVALLSAVLTFAVERRMLSVNPCRGVRRNSEKGREFFYTPTQTKAILFACAGWDDIRAKYIALELLTGCRPNELRDSSPSWRHDSVLRTPDGKTGARTIYLPDAACAILDSLPPRTDGRYFPPAMDMRRAWARVCRIAGVPRARLYDLRHTFASAALAAGESLAVIGIMLGHRKAQTTLRYSHLAPDIGVRAAQAAAMRMS